MTRNMGAELRSLMETNAPVIAPLCLEPLVGRLIEELGFKAGYVGGGALGFSLAISEALLTINDVALVTRQIVQRVGIPIIVDGTVGFGDAVHMARAVWELESAGAAGVEFGDQIAPKRAHHHKGIDHLVETEVFAAKIEEAVRVRENQDFLLVARTGAAREDGLDEGIERAHAYVDAGADAVLIAGVPEQEWKRLRDEFRPTQLVLMGRETRAQAAELGASLVLDPFTANLVAFRAVKQALEAAMRGEPPEHIEDERPAVSGIQQLWDIEARTTEKPLYE